MPRISVGGVRSSKRVASREALDDLTSIVARAKAVLVASFEVARQHPKATDWFLDNLFTIQGSLRQVRSDMPAGFYDRLPEQPHAGLSLPRVYLLAAEILIATELQPDRVTIESHVQDVQKEGSLTIAELWALPTFLRLRTLEVLVEDLAGLLPLPARGRIRARDEDRLTRIDVEERVASCVRTLRTLNGIRWQVFFRHCSEVERIFVRDPGRAYKRMDFETQDRYRKAVEEIAWRTPHTEVEVAQKALNLAHRAAVDGGRQAHVGHYLVGEGVKELERFFRYRPRPMQRLRRWLMSHAALVLLVSIALSTAAFLFVPAWYLKSQGANVAVIALGLLLGGIPASTLGVTLVNWVLTHLLEPRVLSKMDFSEGIPPAGRTLVVVPCLLGSAEEVRGLVRQLELHYMRNPDPELRFALLSDFVDASEKRVTGDDALIEAARTGVRLLNQHYGAEGVAPFHLFHRERLWNESEGVWMGWERKRGKIEELNAFLLGKERATTFTHEVGEPDGLEGIQFVITLDVGTILPRGAAARLSGVLAHPLNRPRVDPDRRCVTEGHAVIQPRVEISPANSRISRFTRIFAADNAIDIYSRAVSDVYQDLSGQGIYVGKGIYDLRAFHECLEGRCPQNTLVSHDHVEGMYARAALASDVVLLEDYPPQYLAYSHRLHRWTRGDWQFLPWLRGTVRDAAGSRARNPIPILGRWVLLDNLRRSLLSPATLILLTAGWLWLPGHPAVWTLAALLATGGHVLTGLASELIHVPRRGRLRPWAAGCGRHLRQALGRWLFYLAFLCQEALVSSDAIVRSVVRMAVTHRHLLQWKSADHTARLLASRSPHLQAWTEMAGSPVLAVGLSAAILSIRPGALPWAAPLLAVWLVAPEVARRISRILPSRAERPSERDAVYLRRLARRTWLFFESFVGPDDQWLPPDNFQEHPLGEIAHRTSPTNVGMLLSSTLAAYDLGYVGPTTLSFRARNTLDTLDRLQLFRGHLYNWYDTRTLEPLEPRYVSTVDSGNLAAALVVLKQGCAEIATSGSFLSAAQWRGLCDALRLLEEAIERTPESLGAVAGHTTRDLIERVCRQVEEVVESPERWFELLAELCGSVCSEIDRTLADWVGARHADGDPGQLREVRLWLDRVHHHLLDMKREADLFAPWHPMLLGPEVAEVLEMTGKRADELRDVLTTLSVPGELAAMPALCENGKVKLAQLVAQLEGEIDNEADRRLVFEWLERLSESLSQGSTNAARLQEDLLAIASRSDSRMRAMDFRLLYDSPRGLFRIGYDASSGRFDPNHYDLLASEARIASFLAIAKGDAPVKHWFQLQRPVFRIGRRATLLSWGGTMFEYAMPCLWMRSGDRSLLMDSVLSVADAQRSYGEGRNVPWGISESGFYQSDARNHYQYRSFGVPGLGLRRGLSDDLVIAPYASALVLAFRPADVVHNLRRLEELGVLGTYGFYEAIDFTKDRAPIGKDHAIVASYMAHHQGMILSAIDNALEQDALVRRFRRDALTQTTELLLYEASPLGTPQRPAPDVPSQLPAPARPRIVLPPWRPARSDQFEDGLLLSNGHMSSFVSEDGSGWIAWDELALTRWRMDPTRNEWGSWVYVRDEDSGALWSAGRAPTGRPADEEHVIFHPHLAEFQRRDHGIFLRMEVAVAPSDDVEVRHVTVTNETSRARRLSLTSCAEPVLTDLRGDARHPAFSKLFVHSEHLPEEEALLFHRRQRSNDEHPVFLLHRLIAEDGALERSDFETDRGAFLGRCRTAEHPRALDLATWDGGLGDTLDPLFAIRGMIRLDPYETVRVAFVTVAAGSRRGVIEVARRHRTLETVDWALQEAQAASIRNAERQGLDPGLLPSVHRLVSLLQRPRPALRGNPAAIAANRLGKPALWGHGLSGDLPILLVRLGDPKEGVVFSNALQAHRYWRERGMRIDLVVLLQGSSTYGGEDEEEVSGRIRRHRSAEWMNRPGGIFVIHVDQVPVDQRNLLEAVARVVLDAAHGGLADQLAVATVPRELPGPLLAHATPADIEEPTPALDPGDELLLWNGFGGFSRDGSEYVIRLAPGKTTPAPWCNVIANPGFGCLVSESGLGTAWSINSSLHRLTSWSNDPVSDPPSQVLYLRDEESGAVWTPTPLPAGPSSECHVHHGAGYTEFHRHSHGLGQRLRTFVPRNAPLEIVQLRLRNLWSHPRRVTATFFAELVQGESREGSFLTAVHEYDEETRSLLTRNPWAPEFAERTVFLASSEPTHGLTVDREEFLGRHHALARPAALERWGLSGNVQAGLDPCQALMVHIELAPGEERNVWFLFGEGEDREASLELVKRFRKSDAVEAAWKELSEFWNGFLGSVEVKTPEPSMDILLNRWLPYQVLSSRIEARAGFYQSSGGFGFRDQLQDVMALVHSAPERARAHITEAAARQFSEGDVLHWWHPPANQGVRTRCSDDLLWLPYVTAHYVHATGDHGILRERVPFLEAEPLGENEHERYGLYGHGSEDGTLLEHCRRAIERGLKFGPNGLPAMGGGDWNDGMNRVGIGGRGESVWLAWFVCCLLEGFASLLESEEEEQEATHWRGVAADLLRATEAVGWDGEWYRRAWYDDESPIGSRAAKECRIDLIAQAWATFAGAPEDHVRRALASVEELLVDEEQRLILLLAPPFRGEEKDPGYIASYPPGIRENGGQYTHAATWLGWAHVKRGGGDAAERIFRLLNPATRLRDSADANRYRVEPYVLAGDVYGVEPHLGRGGWTWYTGAASWMWRLGVEGILGLRLVEGDLVVEPCLPTDWNGFEAIVRTGHGECKIVAERVKGCDELRIYLDGERLPSGRIPLPSLEGHHEVRVDMPFAEKGKPVASRRLEGEEHPPLAPASTPPTGERLRPWNPEDAKSGE